MRSLAAVAPILLLLAGCASTHRGPEVQPASASAFWVSLGKTLPGTWKATTASGKTVTVQYRLVSGGSALLEDWAPASEHETVSVYHPDGDAVRLTHYCAQGNQPRLVAVEATEKRAVFRLLDATNVKPDAAVMRELTLTLASDTLERTEVYRQPDGSDEKTTLRFAREVKTVLFVCEHGAAKSVMAAAYFNKLAAERGLPYRAIARGLTPQEELSTAAVAGLEADKVDYEHSKPMPLKPEEMDGAARVVTFCPLTTAVGRGIEEHLDVPAPKDGYPASREKISGIVKRLVDDLATGTAR